MSVNGETITTIKRTEVTVTTEAAGGSGINLGPMPKRDSVGGNKSRSANSAYSVHISADNYVSSPDQNTLPAIVRASHQANTVPAAPQRQPNPGRRHIHKLNNAAWSYTKCAILFFTAILITWIPSSANRVYSVIHPGDTSAALQFMSAFVLPLQGFWNALIYGVTSWSACKNLFHDLKQGRRPAVSDIVGGIGGGNSTSNSQHRFRSQLKSPVRGSRTFESESMTELAKTRTNSADGGHSC